MISLIPHTNLHSCSNSYVEVGVWGIKGNQTENKYLEAVANRTKIYATAFYAEKNIGAIWVCSNAKGRGP